MAISAERDRKKESLSISNFTGTRTSCWLQQNKRKKERKKREKGRKKKSSFLITDQRCSRIFHYINDRHEKKSSSSSLRATSFSVFFPSFEVKNLIEKYLLTFFFCWSWAEK
jgi:hypothetical protein